MDDNESISSKLSWASQLTNCESFEKMLSCTWTNVSLQRKIGEVIVSLKNTILSTGGSESPTEFYATLIALMKNTDLDNSTLEACGYIMNALLSTGVSSAVLRHTTSDISKIVMNAFSGPNGGNENVIRFGLLSLSRVLKVQGNENWRLDNVKHMYRSLFAYTCDSRPSINEFARKAVVSIFEDKFKSSGAMSHKHPLHKETVALLANNIRQTNVLHSKNNDVKNLKVKPSADDDKLSFSLTTISHLLLAKVLNNEAVVSYVETLIQCLLSMQIVPIQCQILSIFTKLFRSDIFLPEVSARCLSSLFKYIDFCVSSNTNSNISIAPPSFIGKTWLNTVLIGFESLLLNKEKNFIESGTSKTLNCREVALAHVTSLIKVCSDWLLCDDQEMKVASNAILNKICSGYLITTEDKSNYLDTNEYSDTDKWLVKWTEVLGRHLNTQHEVMWSEILENVTFLIDRSNGKCPTFINNIIQVVPKMAELRDSYEDMESEIIATLTSTNMKNCRTDMTTIEKKLKVDIESLIGQIIKNYGIDHILNVIPLNKIINEDENILRDLNNRTWLVPLAKTYVEKTSPEKFRIYFLPFIQLLTTKIDSLTMNENSMDTEDTKSSSVAKASLGMLRYQLWSCLPSFAKNTVVGGIQEVPNSFWEMMLGFLNPNESSNLEAITMNTLRNLVKTAQDQDEMKRVLTSSVFFPKVLQNLFSLYMKNDNNMQNNIKITLDSYLRIFEPETFNANCDFLLNKKLATMDLKKPLEDQLLYMELMIILSAHMTVEKLAEVTTFMLNLLENSKDVDSKIQKRVYRFLDIITSSNTPTSNEYTKENLKFLLAQLSSFKNVKNDSWKCRMKTLYNLFKLMNTSAEIANFLNEFLGEIINCLNLKGKKTRAVSGLILVEGIIGCSVLSEDEETTLSQSINRMLQQLIETLKKNLTDNTKSAVAFKEALSKALFLVLSESRLAKAVTREHIEDTLSIVTEILSNHDSKNDNRHLVHVGLDILVGLLKSKKLNYSRVEMSDIGSCLKSAKEGLLKKVRTSVKKILRKMLKWWSYEDIKKCLPEELVPVLRNLHKEGNRQNRSEEKDAGDNESTATSWACFSENGSQNTMRNPNIKNIAELLEDSDDDLESQFSRGMSIGGKSEMSGKSGKSGKSSATNMTKASELRKIRKRKIEEANNTLWLEEKDGEVVDISDVVNVAQHLRVSRPSDKKVTIDEKTVQEKIVDKRGFRMEGGRLLIGNIQSMDAEVKQPGNKKDDSDDEDNTTEKGRFQPPKKRVRKEKMIGSEYKSFKKGAFGDIKKAGMPDPYGYVEMNGAFTGKMKSYMSDAKKSLKAARVLSKESRKKTRR